MISKAKARASAAAEKARAALDNDENENPQLEAPPQLAPPAFGSGPEEEALPAGWESAISRSTGETYYINTATGDTQYEWPTAVEEAEGSRRESLKARAAQAKAKAAKAASATKSATRTLSNSEAVGAVRDELREAKHKAQSKAGERAREAAERIQHFVAVLPVLSSGEDDFLDGIEDEDGFGEQDMSEAQSALEEMSRQVSSRLVDMTELLDEEKELRLEAEREAQILRQELEALWTATRQAQAKAASPGTELGVTPPVPEPEEVAPSPAPSSTADDEEQDPEQDPERRTYTPSDEELREAVNALREETEGMGMGKMRKALQARRKWAVSEKRLRAMIRSIETGVELDKTEDQRVETVEMLSSTCMELQSTVQRQKKQLQKQRKQLAEAREQMIKLQTYADACKAENDRLKGGGGGHSKEVLPPPPVSYH